VERPNFALSKTTVREVALKKGRLSGASTRKYEGGSTKEQRVEEVEVSLRREENHNFGREGEQKNHWIKRGGGRAPNPPPDYEGKGSLRGGNDSFTSKKEGGVSTQGESYTIFHRDGCSFEKIPSRGRREGLKKHRLRANSSRISQHPRGKPSY